MVGALHPQADAGQYVLFQAILLVSGGVSFTIGAIIYAVKKPRMIPGIFSFHELFHILVLIGGVLHYAMIYGVYSHPGV